MAVGDPIVYKSPGPWGGDQTMTIYPSHTAEGVARSATVDFTPTDRAMAGYEKAEAETPMTYKGMTEKMGWSVDLAKALITEAQWVEREDGGEACPWCENWETDFDPPAHEKSCKAAIFMNWERR